MSDIIPNLVSIALFIITLVLLYVNFKKSGFCFSCSLHIELTNKTEGDECIYESTETRPNEEATETTDPSL
jgi:hypothetical protein